MRRKKIKFLGLAGIAALLMATPVYGAGKVGSAEIPYGPGWESEDAKTDLGAQGEEAAQGEQAAQNEPTSGAAESSSKSPEWLTDDITQVVVVLADGAGSSGATVSYYSKKESWEEVFRVRGIIGKAGMASPEEKREGDKKTPSGVYSFIKAFGIKEDPGSVMEYHKIRTGDYWVDDSASAHYNRLVNLGDGKKDWNSAENLSQMAPWYNYCLALSYNEEQTAGKGSAIFLHVMRDGDAGTSGCIAIPQEPMKQVLQNADKNTRIVLTYQNK